jgi:putative tricarboxylic transport membrane protein
VSGDRLANGSTRGSPSALIFALAVVALGGFVVFEALTGPDNPGYARVGPGAFPGVVGGALVFVGLALLLESLRGHWRVVWIERETLSVHSRASGNPEGLGPRFRGDERSGGVPFRNVLLVAVALILDVVLMTPLGFVVASGAMFALVAAGFGSRRHLIDVGLGLAFSGAIYLVFVRGLGLHLPIGTVWGMLPWMS